MTGTKKPLWTCPKCGHQFVTPNLWHSCARYEIEDHFTGKDPAVRELYEQFRDLVFRECGPVTVYAQKTRIVFQARARFTGVVVRKRWLDAAVWLKRRLDLPRFRRIEAVGPRDHIHYFRLSGAADFDEELAGLVREAYAVGCQEA